MLIRKALLLAAGSCLVFGIGCSSPNVTKNPVRIDPNTTSRESGSTDDIYEAVQFVIDSLNVSPRIAQQVNNRVILSRIVNRTGIADYDENIIYNKFLSRLVNTSDKLEFLERDSVASERSLQQSGEVETQGIGKMKGAAMALTIELRHLRGANSKTIQYTFRLTNLDGVVVWLDAKEIKKRA